MPVAEGLRSGVRAEAACFALISAVYLAHFWHAGYDRFYHDAAGYWEGGRRFGEDAAFSFFGYDDPLRGYAFPLYNFLLQTIADAIDVSEVAVVRVSGALLPLVSWPIGLVAGAGVVLYNRLKK